MRRPELEGETVDAKLIERIEVGGQRPTPGFVRALAALWEISIPRVRALLRRVA